MNQAYTDRDTLPGPLLTAARVRELDQWVMAAEAIPAFVLMQRAGEAAFALLCQRWPQARQLTVLAGAGNNGGDAWVVAALAQQQGLQVCLLTLGDISSASAAAQQARAQALQAGVTEQTFAGELPAATQVIVDGLLGTGLNGPVREECAVAIAAMNAHPAPVLALDIPSGLHADSGCPMPCAVQAQVTVTFIGVKQGLLTAAGPDCCGELHYAALTALDLPVADAAERISWQRLEQLGQRLPERARNAHKGDFGHVLLVGGDTGMGGAVLLAAEASARCGAGLVSCATRPDHVPVLLTRCPVIMARGVRSGLELQPLLERASVLAAGPGLGQSSWSELLLQQVLHSRLPLVLDADALNLLASPGWRCEFGERPVVLTPHPGEAARLLGCSTDAVQQDRFRAARQLAARFAAVVVLKGHGSLVAAPDGRVAVCSDGNPGMSSGGMGDVLTGVIAALLAQGMSAWQAARYGVCVHAAAADRLAAQRGPRGMLASDLTEVLQEFVN